MKLTGWGKYPTIEAEVFTPNTISAISNKLKNHTNPSAIARGLGRSYGDSSLAETILSSASLNHFLDFNPDTGLLNCASGVSLAEILQTFVPKGWFLPVTPGTKFVTIGGAIASDVHGKNHHLDGCFSEFINKLTLATATGELLKCSRTENSDLFYATCGGMGLTGVIVSAELQLQAIGSAQIDETTIKAHNLAHALELFENNINNTYSVAWIDCLASGDNLGRSLLMLGEHSNDGPLDAHKEGALSIPVDMPGIMLNRFSIQAFNTLYYNRVRQETTNRTVHYEPFFYPLDGIHDWNRMYGKNGFTQYQFVIPKAAGLEGMTTILKRIADSKRGSFLAVLKVFGKANDNWLSFPIEGYTLALDFKLDLNLLTLLDELDKIVLSYGGRVYLTKDVRMSSSTFKQSYPNWEKFVALRQKYGADKHFNSLQSKRLGL